MLAEGIPLDLPENPAPYLVNWLMEVGPVGSGGMGPVPIGWADLQTWQTLTAVEIDPWEARTLVRLSRDFVAEMERAKDPVSAAPHSTGVTNEQAITDQFKAMMRFARSMKSKEGTR